MILNNIYLGYNISFGFKCFDNTKKFKNIICK